MQDKTISLISNKDAELPVVALRQLLNKEVASRNRVKALKILLMTLLEELKDFNSDDETEKVNRIDLMSELERYEIDLIRYALLQSNGKQRAAAKLLNLKVTTLNAKIKRFGILPNGLMQSSK